MAYNSQTIDSSWSTESDTWLDAYSRESRLRTNPCFVGERDGELLPYIDYIGMRSLKRCARFCRRFGQKIRSPFWPFWSLIGYSFCTWVFLFSFSSLLIRPSTKDPRSALNIHLNWEANYKVGLIKGLVLNRVSNFWSGYKLVRKIADFVLNGIWDHPTRVH